VVKTQADVVSLQEIEVNDSWSKGLDQGDIYQNLLQQKTGLTWYKVWFHRAGGTSGLGQLILSKYPFNGTAGEPLLANRSALDATIAVNGRTINFTSVHLDNVDAANRNKEVDELLPWAATFAENRIIVGDYNAWPQTAEIAKMKASYFDAWPEAQTMATAIGNGITHGSHRIDYIFYSKGATQLALKSVQIYNTADAKGVRPSDHEPILAVFEVR
jgi:endonuclease/exonuclease/phosphatase family metal-dependent hydrolase